MDPEGPNLRRMYLPGLDALKEKLAAFEWLMLQLHPHLYGHIQQYGVPSVLYASQWFMTLFSTPFPSHFSARVIDIMLQVGLWLQGSGRGVVVGCMHIAAVTQLGSRGGVGEVWVGQQRGAAAELDICVTCVPRSCRPVVSNLTGHCP